MKLTTENLSATATWQEKGYILPSFDIAAMRKKTHDEPIWVHFGAGNIFRAFPAARQQELLDKGLSDRGIIVAEGFDEEIITKAYAPFDNLSLAVTLKADGTVEKKVVASVAESLTVSGGMERLHEIFKAPSLQMVSFTITEKGYSTTRPDGTYPPFIAADLEAGPDGAHGLMGVIAALCYTRYQAGAKPLALVSMDNCSHNGEKLQAGVLLFVEKWAESGKVEPGFVNYMKDGSVSFPWSMIDKITPRPAPEVVKMLEADGYEDTEVVCTSKNTWVSSFVNAEECEYLVVEDSFPNGRPCLEKAGPIFATRDTVERVEKMKVCTCLNPLHTILAVFGCLMGYTSISAEMKDERLTSLIRRAGYDEAMPVVVDPGIIRPTDFLGEVLNKRLPNPFVPDTPQRIACDTSQKIPVRFGETLKIYQETGRSFADLEALPIFFAGWLRYLMGINDAGEAFEISPDPMLDTLRPHLSQIKLGDKGPFTAQVKPILSDAKIFGVNLYEIGLGEKVEAIFAQLVSGKGAIAKLLEGRL